MGEIMNHFDRAIAKLKNYPGMKQRTNPGLKAASRYSSESKLDDEERTIVRDGNHIHTADGVDLFDPDTIRLNEEMLVRGDND
jgi:hypothetical protein